MTIDPGNLKPEPVMPEYPARVIVDLDAIRENTAALAQYASGSAVLAVVKADAYGHGLIPAARAAISGGATWLGTAQVSEALALRAAGYTGPILTWLYSPHSSLDEAVAADIDITVSADWALARALDAATRLGKQARIHLKIDTGLSRNGCPAQQWPSLTASARDAELAGHITVVGIWSHFANADTPGHPSIGAQLDSFEEASMIAHTTGLRPMRHLANSAATLTLPEAHFDIVRPGIAIYGISPLTDRETPIQLRPAMRVEADLAAVKDVEAGVGVSYGHRYVTTERTTLALVPMGYADGIPRQASGHGPVLAGGRRLRVAGTVCMDQFIVDLGPGSDAKAGDTVTLFGSGHDGEPSAADWADAAGTISYEIVTRMAPRIPRTYVGEPLLEDW